MDKSFDFSKLLQNHQKMHKTKPVEFISVGGAVKKRRVTQMKHTKNARLSIFDKIRNIEKYESPIRKQDPKSKVEHRMKLLARWKEDKEKRRKEASSQKTKPFITGVVRNPVNFVPPPPPKPMPSTSGRVTRSQTTKMNNKNNTSKSKPVQPTTNNAKSQTKSIAPENAKFNPILNNLKPIELHKPTSNKKNVSKVSNKPLQLQDKAKSKSKKADVKKSKVNKNSNTESLHSLDKSPVQKKESPKKIFTPKNPVPKSESSSEEKLRSPKPTNNGDATPETEAAQKISPCITMSRGKDNARKEMKKKMEEGLLADDVCEMENMDHFRRQLDSEIKRMTEMCNTWEKISEQIPLPEPVQEAVLGAVGQARLLMSQKLQQFASLLSRAERPDPCAAPVTPADLQGFWDMVFIQVENIDMRFKKLEEMRERNWTVEAPPTRPPASRAPRPAASRPIAPRPAPGRPAAASRLRDLIAAKRKEKKEQNQQEQDVAAESKTFEAGFFSVSSPVRAAATPRRSVLQSVLSSEAKRASASASASKNNASYAMLRASLIGRNVDNDHLFTSNQVPLTPVNLCATPARSILKSGNSKSTKKSRKKSIKVVLFDDDDNGHQNTSLIEKESNINNSSVEEVKENIQPSRRKSKLLRQDALEDRSPVMTRSRRKSCQTPVVEVRTEQTPRSRR